MVTPEIINFMATHGRGLICLSLTEDKADKLELNPMVRNNETRFGTAFTVSIDASTGVNRGVSAHDRAHTILTAISEDATPRDLVQPGHIFPLRARKGGVLVRGGQTEGSVDLSRLAGLKPAGVICEIMNDDGTMSRMPELVRFADEHQMNIVTIADLIAFRIKHELLMHRMTEKSFQTDLAGEWRIVSFTSEFKPDATHIALVNGEIRVDDHVPVILSNKTFAEDLIESFCLGDGGELHRAMETIATEGRGILLYLSQEGGNVPLHEMLDACSMQERGLDAKTFEEVGRNNECNYIICAHFLKYLGARKIHVYTRNPKEIRILEDYEIKLSHISAY
jgi:3,4-dihydroxy 2-butanone 4-phosphate synthase/GTP cyclohydrolase II